MQTESVIVPIFDRRQHIDARIAAIEGRIYVRKPTFYRNTETGEDYYAIVGSIGFPLGRTPGFAVVVSVLKELEYEKAPRLKVLDEIEETTLVGMLSSCEQVRWKWGYPKSFNFWVGDASHFMLAISEFNDRIERGIYLSPPSDFEDARKDQVYLQTIRQLLSPGPDGVKRLLIGDNPKLRSHLQNVQPDIRKVEQAPALAALAFSAHTILATTPWLEFTEPQRFYPTIREDGFERMSLWPWEEPFQWDDSDNDSEEGRPLDDGELIRTI